MARGRRERVEEAQSRRRGSGLALSLDALLRLLASSASRGSWCSRTLLGCRRRARPFLGESGAPSEPRPSLLGALPPRRRSLRAIARRSTHTCYSCAPLGRRTACPAPTPPTRASSPARAARRARFAQLRLFRPPERSSTIHDALCLSRPLALSGRAVSSRRTAARPSRALALPFLLVSLVRFELRRRPADGCTGSFH